MARSGDRKIRYTLEGGGSINPMVSSARSALRTLFSESTRGLRGSAQSIQGPKVNLGNLTSAMNAQQRVMRSSGQAYQSFVTGFTSSSKKLEAAGRSMSMGGSMGGTSAGFGRGYSSYGTRLSPTGRVVVSAKDLIPQVENVALGKPMTQFQGDPERIAAALQQLKGYDRAVTKLMEQAALSQARYDAKMRSYRDRRMEASREGQRWQTKYTGLTTGLMGTKTKSGDLWLIPTKDEARDILAERTSGIRKELSKAVRQLDSDQKKLAKATGTGMATKVKGGGLWLIPTKKESSQYLNEIFSSNKMSTAKGALTWAQEYREAYSALAKISRIRDAQIMGAKGKIFTDPTTGKDLQWLTPTSTEVNKLANVSVMGPGGIRRNAFGSMQAVYDANGQPMRDPKTGKIIKTWQHDSMVLQQALASNSAAPDKLVQAALRELRGLDEIDKQFTAAKQRAASIEAKRQAVLKELTKNIPGTPGAKPSTAVQAFLDRVRGVSTLQGRITATKATKSTLEGQIAAVDKEIKQNVPGTKGAAPTPGIQKTLAEIRNLGAIEKLIATAGKEYSKIVKALEKLGAQKKVDDAKIAAKQKALDKNPTYVPALKELRSALKATTPIPKELDYWLQNSYDMRREFSKQLGINAPYSAAPTDALMKSNPVLAGRMIAERENFSKALLNMGITPENVKVSYDFERGLYHISGAAKGLNGTMGEWNMTLDQNFNKVTGITRAHRGMGGAVRETITNFQKVIQWTVATSLVFGSLAAVMGSITKISEINTDLIRFGITAQKSMTDAKKVFNEFAQVAYDTATPLKELTTVMDDIALATRKSTQTVAQWDAAMIELAKSVGILTNLTGIDTVRATDLLSAAYKQLKIAPEQLLNVLNKVTAVAGGNAQAIEDLVASLGSVSEAAAAAGLTLDQQLASVQTISQVTNKSASEVAVAFKNLFGSLSSKGAENTLKKFGISTRDATGGMRDFLDVYSDIFDAIQTGRISEAQMPDLLRGISGGPRRAPDAAALLANFKLIQDQYTKSVNATNDALIANARVMDTNTAKVQKLRNVFDTALVNTFTDSVNKLIGSLVGLGEAVNSLPVIGGGKKGEGSAIAEFLTQSLALMALAGIGTQVGRIGFRGIKSGRKDLSGFMKFANNFAPAWMRQYDNPIRAEIGNLPKIEGFQRYGKGANQHYVGIGANKGFNPPPNVVIVDPNAKGRAKLGQNFAWGLTQMLGSSKARMGTGALLGAGLGAAAVGVGGAITGNTEGIAALTQTIGGGLLMFGGPIGAAAGAGLLAISGIMGHFAAEENKAAEATKSLKYAIYDNLKQYSAEKRAYEDALKLQTDSSRVIDNLTSKTKLNAEETQQLSKAQETYIDSTFAMMDAQNQMYETMEKIKSQIPELSSRLLKYKTVVDSLGTAQGQKDLATLLASDILGITNPFATSSIKFNDNPQSSIWVGQGNPATLGVNPYYPAGAPGSEGPDLQWIMDQAKSTQEAIGFVNDAVNLPLGIRLNRDIVQYLGKLLSNADEATKATDSYTSAMKIFTDWLFQMGSTGSQVTRAIDTQGALIKAQTALGILTSEQATAAAGRQAMAEFLKPYINNIPGFVGGNGEGPASGPAAGAFGNNLQATKIRNLLFGGPEGTGGILGSANYTAPIDMAAARDYLKALQQTGLIPGLDKFKEGTQAFDIQAYKAVVKLGYAVSDADEKVKKLAEDFTELKDAVIGSLNSATLSKYDELVSLQAQKQGGDFSGNMSLFTKQTEDAKKWISAYDRLKNQVTVNPGAIAGVGTDIGQVIPIFGSLIEIAKTNPEQVLDKLFGWVDQLGLKGENINKFTDSLIYMMDNLSSMNGIKTALGFTIDTPTAKIKQYLETLRATLVAQAAATEDPKALSNLRQRISVVDTQLGIIGAYQGAENNLKSAIASGNPNAYNSSGGGGPSSGLYDVPKEIMQQTNPNSLIQQAIKKARELQHKIKGADAAAKGDTVTLLDGTKIVMTVKDVGEEYLRRAMEELTNTIQKNNDLLTKTDASKLIRVGYGSFSALANVPINSQTGISAGGSSGGGVQVTLDLRGQVLTPAQFQELANTIAATIKRSQNS